MTLAKEARYALHLSRREFSRLLGVSVRTIEAWEQSTREPTAAAATLLRLVLAEPEACCRALVALGIQPSGRGRVERAIGTLWREYLESETEDLPPLDASVEDGAVDG